ncbi:MAG: putative membrane protein [Desulfotomaculum sp. 46_296]|nr:MAG: putative membrane protein [Desulfotomaculum sp. 46_296]HAU32548.1 hypothetical protein [Desulfotomaculum sp.]
MKCNDFWLFLIPGIPEVAGVIALSLALGAVPLRWGRIIPAGVVLAILFYVIRISPGVPLFTHMVVGLLILVLIIAHTTKVPLSKSFIIVFTSMALLAILEYLITELFLWISRLSIEALCSNNLLWLFSGLFQAFLMILAAIITTKYIKPDREAWKL